MDKEELTEAIVEALERHDAGGDGRLSAFWRVVEGLVLSFFALGMLVVAANVRFGLGAGSCSLVGAADAIADAKRLIDEGFPLEGWLGDVEAFVASMCVVYLLCLVALTFALIGVKSHSVKEAKDRVGMMLGAGSVGGFLLMLFQYLQQ